MLMISTPCILVTLACLVGCGGAKQTAPPPAETDFVVFVKGMINDGVQPGAAPVDVNTIRFTNQHPQDPNTFQDLFP